jgi:hypothetical protein
MEKYRRLSNINVRVGFDWLNEVQAVELTGIADGCNCCADFEEVTKEENVLALLLGNARWHYREALRLENMAAMLSGRFDECLQAMLTASKLARMLAGPLESGEQLAEASELYSQLGTSEKQILETLQPEVLEKIATSAWVIANDYKE